MKKRILSILLLGGVFILAACSGGAPRIELEVTDIDLGEVVNGEIASRDVAVRNTGDETLVVDSVTTSCSCTSAALEPMSIPPGETANLHIEMDSGAHGPDLTGPLIRQVFLTSNDPEQPEAQVELALEVLPRP
jgi:hypothetical protein